MADLNFGKYDSRNISENLFFRVNNIDYLRLEVGEQYYMGTFDPKYKETPCIRGFHLKPNWHNMEEYHYIEIGFDESFKSYMDKLYNCCRDLDIYLAFKLVIHPHDSGEARKVLFFNSDSQNGFRDYDHQYSGDLKRIDTVYLRDIGLTLNDLVDRGVDVYLEIENGMGFYNDTRTNLARKTLTPRSSGSKNFTQNLSSSISDPSYGNQSFIGRGELRLTYTNGNSDTIELNYDRFSISQDSDLTGPWDTSGCSQSNWRIYINTEKRYCSSNNGNLASYSFSGEYLNSDGIWVDNG